METLTGTVQAGCGLNQKTGMTATGVPPTFVIASELDALSARVEILQRSVLEEQKTMLTTVVEKLDALPSSIGDYIRHNMEINGVVAIASRAASVAALPRMELLTLVVNFASSVADPSCKTPLPTTWF